MTVIAEIALTFLHCKKSMAFNIPVSLGSKVQHRQNCMVLKALFRKSVELKWQSALLIYLHINHANTSQQNGKFRKVIKIHTKMVVFVSLYCHF